MTIIKSEVLDWALWFYWIMATTLGWVLGGTLFTGLPMLAAGVVIAGFQWTVLYRRIPKAWRWFLLSALGWIAGYIFVVLLIPAELNVLTGPILGGILGLAQWSILKDEFDWAGWWIPLSLLAWTTGLTIMPGALTSGSLPAALTGLALVIYFRFAAKRRRA
jgi:hypothetical protein